MLGVEERRPSQRRASLISEIYSENKGPLLGKHSGGGDAGPGQSPGKPPSAPPVPPSGPPGGGSGGGGNTVVPKIRPPPPEVLRRKIPKGKFGLLGMGKNHHPHFQIGPDCFGNVKQ